MIQEERKKIIVSKLQQYGIVRVSELSRELNTTDVTIRHDLNEIQSEGIAIRVHGGAKIKNFSGVKMTLTENAGKSVKERKVIAELSYSLIENHDSILLDSSATVLSLAKLLASAPFEELTVVTTSLPIFLELANVEQYNMLLVGGKYNRKLESTNGPLSYYVLRNLHLDKAFVGVAGIDIRNGFTGPYEEENEIKRLSIECADQSFVMADHSKFGKAFLYSFAKFDDVDGIVTDTFPEENFMEKIRESGARLIV